MDSKLLLVKCITLLYRESELVHTEPSLDLCKAIIDLIKVPDSSLSMQTGREVIVGLRTTLNWMIDHSSKAYEKTQLMQRIRINTKDDTYLYDAVAEGIAPVESEESIKSQILEYRQTLQDYIKNKKIDQIFAKAFNRINIFNQENVDYKKFVREIYDELEPYTRDIVEDNHESIVDTVNLDNDEALVALMTRSKEELSSEGALKTGWQGLNRMCGQARGLRRGETIITAGLQHNFKTGFTLNVFKHLALYNTPYMRDPAKKPMLLHLSLENELTTNVLWLYANLKENETKEAVDISAVNEQEAAKYVRERMTVNGYKIEMRRLDPSLCSIHDFKDMILGYEAAGYEIHAVVVDYLAMMNRQGLDRSGPMGSDIRDLFRRARNITAPRGITLITPHQLSTEAKMLVRQGVDSFVQEIANKGYYDSCRTLDQEVDMEIYMHIEKIPGDRSYLTVQRGKHRGVTITPDKDLYFVMPFHEAGGVRDDIEGSDMSMTSVGGRSKGDGGGEWYDL